ncbi:hypothetical protein [Pseudomonas sp. NPDC089406]|uniref:hypothetical protein n=1 Tax=Pseudomonas sp. NPDC089406 TaxID=3364463 RepID=UPI00384ECC9D
MTNPIDTNILTSYPSLLIRAICAAVLPVLLYAASTQSTLPLDLLNSLGIREFTGQALYACAMNAYAFGLMRINWFDQRIHRKHHHEICRFEWMVEVERLAGEHYPLAAQHAREEQRLLRKRYGSLLDSRTGSTMTSIGTAIRLATRLIHRFQLFKKSDLPPSL